MKIILAYFLTGTLLLSACSAPQPAIATPTEDPVATQVALLLTNMPTATILEPTPTFPPTETPQPETPSPAPPTHTPTPTNPPDDPRFSLGEPTWTDTLENASSFYLFENENTRVTLENNALLLTGLQANGWHGWTLTFSREPKNFYLEATLNPQTCSSSDLYGLIFRAPTASAGYFFGVTCDGRFNLRARNFEDGRDQAIIEMTSNSAILAGSGVTNRLGVMANGSSLALYANGVLLKEVNNASFENHGFFGAFVAAQQTAGFTVRMEEVSLWNLP
jgi:hypothetical protein